MNVTSIERRIFRAYDIRGIVPTELNVSTARNIGRALATKAMSLDVTCITIGRDGRVSSPELAAALCAGIIAEGLDILDVGMVPTPVAYWAALQRTNGSCAVVTGSHNPKDYNGIKMMLAGNTLAGEEVQELLHLIEQERYATSGITGLAKADMDINDHYADALLTTRKLARPIKIVVDCGNGVTGATAPALLTRLGCEVIPLFTEVDGNFPNHHPDPADPANFAAAAAALTEHGAELALAFDGDGDRLGVWLPDSGMIYPDRILMLLAREQLTRTPGATIIYDVKCSINTAPFIAALGGKAVMVRTGHSFVKREMTERQAPFGGELSGHIFFNEGDWRFDDAILAAIRLLELVTAAPSASALFASVPDSAASPEYKVALAPTVDAQAFVRKLAQAGNFPGHRQLVMIDGVRAEWDDGFGLVRPSNTTSNLILRFEGHDANVLARITACFRDCLIRADSTLQLPF